MREEEKTFKFIHLKAKSKNNQSRNFMMQKKQFEFQQKHN